MRDTWKIHEIYIYYRNTWDIHVTYMSKYMRNTWEIHEKYMAILPVRAAPVGRKTTRGGMWG